jgi:ABC-2 type transport system permease protein
VRLGPTLRALPTLLRVGFVEGVAYRAELVVWILSTTMPFIMLALWSAVARDGPVGRFGQAEFTSYFLATFIVRQMTGSWISWQINFEIRHGTLSARLLRPIHPVLTFAAESLAILPLRVVAALPVVFLALALGSGAALPHDPAVWLATLVSLAGAWALGFLASFSIGCLAFRIESSLKVMDVWLVLFWVASGYLVPIELFPAPARAVLDWLPFRYQIGLPVELLTSAHDLDAGLALLARQWAWILTFGALAIVMWRSGTRRYAAYGG